MAKKKLKVKMLTPMAFADRSVGMGEEISLTEKTAVRLVRSGQAEAVKFKIADYEGQHYAPGETQPGDEQGKDAGPNSDPDGNSGAGKDAGGDSGDVETKTDDKSESTDSEPDEVADEGDGSDETRGG